MNWLLPLREYLVEVWNAALFGQLKTRDGNFNSDGVTQAVHSKCFWSYLEMCSVVMSVMAELGSWAEDCPCRSWNVKHLKSSKHRKSEVSRRFLKLLHGKTKLLPGDACGMWSFCPNRGKRAAEMACGKVIAVCMALFDKAMGTVVAFCNGLSAVDMQSVVDFFSQSQSTLVTIITLKTQFWVTLPWKLAGLFHWDKDAAVACAKECMNDFQRRPVDAEHHRITVEFLSESGKWRAQVEDLSNGASLLTLPEPFIARCLELGLVPIVERLMEQRHAFVTQRLRIGNRKGRAPTTISLGAGRMEEIELRLDMDPHFSDALAGNVTLMRDPRAALAKFGLSAHPRVAAQCNLLGSTTGLPGQKLQHSSQLWLGGDLVPTVWSRPIQKYREGHQGQSKGSTRVGKAEAKIKAYT